MLRDHKIRTRLLAGFGTLVLLLILLGFVSLKNQADQRRILADFYAHPFKVTQAIRRAQVNIVRMHRGVKDAVLYAGNRQELATILKGIDDEEKIVYEELAVAREGVVGDKSKIDQIKSMMDEWRGVRAKTTALIYQNRLPDAIAAHKTYARDLVSRIDTMVDDVLKTANDEAATFMRDAAHSQQITYVFTAFLTIFAIALSVVIGLMITSSIVNPLREAMTAADRLATGDLSVEIDSDAADETGQLQRAMGRMVRSLRSMGETANRIARGDLEVEVVPNSERDVFGSAMKNMVEALKRMAATADRIAAGDLTVRVAPASEKDRLGTSFATMAGNLRELNEEIHEVVNVLATSASEIMSTVTEFASSSAQTASAISETNATVLQVRQTTDLSSQKARHVYETAQKSVSVARAGTKSVDDAISCMEGIHEQMGFIAERIVTLAEQSQAIGEIIATVNDLAEQSNLLAVNAAIEAAKAGEHGKGFAVVAQEVKNLATQSKQATAQIRGILGDIQKATTAAVLTTEQGSKAVEAGVKQSAAAGEAIRSLTVSIEESSNSTLQIVTSTQEQAIGMDQIATAIQSINQASGQNVDGSRQIEAATRNIYELNRKLQQLVSRYKVS